MSDPISRPTPSIEERRIALDEKKWDDEFLLRKAEIEAKAKDSQWSGRLSPLIVTLAAGILTLAGSVVGTILQGASTLRLEREKFNFSKTLESQKEQHELILKMISVGNEEQARSNIEFLAETGLINDASLAKKLLDAKAQAVLPRPSVASSSNAVRANPNLGEVLKRISPEAIELFYKLEVGGRDAYLKSFAHPRAQTHKLVGVRAGL